MKAVKFEGSHAALRRRRAACAGAAPPAQDWPSRNVTVVVPIPAGVASDIIARVVFEQVGKQVGQTFVIENRPGAGGTIGASMVAKAAPDGHTILVYGSIAAANALYSKLPYDTAERFHAGGLVRPAAARWWSSPAPGYKTLAELVAAAQGQARRAELFDRRASARPRISAPRGWRSAPASRRSTSRSRAREWLTEIIAGRLDFTVPPVTDGLRRRSATASLSRSRSVARQRISPLARRADDDRGGADGRCDLSVLHRRLSAGEDTARTSSRSCTTRSRRRWRLPAVQERFKSLGVEPMPMTVAEFGKFFKDDIAANLALVKAANIPTQ